MALSRALRSARVALVVGNVAIAAGIWATYGTLLGRARWHDAAVYAALVVAALLAIPLLRHRRLTTLLLASTGAWSMITGILLVYVTPWLPGGRWMTWWHGATSAAFFLAFLAHWARNDPRLWGLVAKLRRPRRALAGLVAGWALVGLLGAASLGAQARAAFTERVFGRACDLAFWGAGALATGGLLAARMPGARAMLARTPVRDRLRGAVDASLLLSMWLATITGFLLQYAGRALRTVDVYWLTSGWHVVLSFLLLALVAFHAAFNLRPLASHAR